jgi:hypothetical protein
VTDVGEKKRCRPVAEFGGASPAVDGDAGFAVLESGQSEEVECVGVPGVSGSFQLPDVNVGDGLVDGRGIGGGFFVARFGCAAQQRQGTVGVSADGFDGS